MTVEELTFSKIVPMIMNSYRSIDIRMILAKPKSDPFAQWTCVFLTIRLTEEDEIELLEKHSNKVRELGNIRTSFFRVVLIHKDIQEFSRLMNIISRGNVPFDQDLARLLGSDLKNIMSKTVSMNSKYTTSEEMSGNNHCILFSTMDNSIASEIRNMALTKKDLGGFEVSQLHSWCDTGNLDNGNTINVVIVVTIYCRKFRVPHRKIGSTLAIYEIDRLLIDECKANILDENSGTLLKTIKRQEMKTIQKNNDTVIVALLGLIEQSLLEHILRIEIWHNYLGVIASDLIDQNDTSPPYGKPLIDAFSLFRASEKMKEYVLSTDDKRQVRGTSWLLSLMGFGSINLGVFQNKDESTIEGWHSADILSYNYQTNTLIIVDCTTNVPDTQKIVKIKNTAEFIKRRIRIPTVPMVFSSVECQGIKDYAKDIGVSIIDKNDLDMIVDALLRGKDVSSLFYTLIS